MTEPGSQPTPGWYHAAGDPPGTQRYWDGAQWQGGPQAVGASTPGGAVAAGFRPAEHGPRFIAALIDGGIVVGIYIGGLILSAIFGAIADSLGTLVFLLTLLGAFGFSIYNQIFLLGSTGQSIGKKMQGVKVVGLEGGQPIGIGGAVLRWLAQVILSIPCGIPPIIDAVMILIDEDRQRFSDKFLKFRVTQL